MGGFVPLVHRVEHVVGLMHGKRRAFDQHVQIAVGHHRGDLDDAIDVGPQPGHLHVDPDQAGLVAANGGGGFRAPGGVIGLCHNPEFWHTR